MMAHKIEHVVVAGAGIGGLMSALGLARNGIRVTLLERDDAPPQDIAPADSMDWLRKGVPQSLHPHFFMGRLRVFLETHYPEIVAALFAAGADESCLDDYVHPQLQHKLTRQPDDQRLRTINCRRTTFEMTVRQIAERDPHISVRNGVRVESLLAEAGEAGTLAVTGVRFNGPNDVETLHADAVIDASGRFSNLAQSLAEFGVTLSETQRDSGLWYFTRHYKLKPGQSKPGAFGLPGAQFADFTVGALPADNGAFTVTYQVYREDQALTKAMRNSVHFQRVSEGTSQPAAWVDPKRTEATSEVFGFGQMDSFWRSLMVEGEPQVLNYFCVGDSAVRSNPKFGRGCTWTTLAAHQLSQLLATDVPAATRVRDYEAWLEAEFRADWHTMRDIDRSTEKAFAVALGLRTATLSERLTQYVQAFVNDAIILEPNLFRDLWTGYNGFQNMSSWSKRPANWARLLRAWLLRGRYTNLLSTQRGRLPHTVMAAGDPVEI